MENKSHALAAGLFVLVVSAMLIALAAWLTRDTTSRDTYELSTREAVSGLQEQAPVRFRGVSVGKVTRISFDPAKRGNVLVRIAVDKDAPVTRSTYATLNFQGVTGLSFVQLDDDGSSTEPPESHEGGPPRIPLRAGLLGEITDRAQALVDKLDTTAERINALLADENQKTLLTAVQSLGDAARDMGSAARSVQQFAINTDKTIEAQFGPRHSSIPQLVRQTTRALQSVEGAGQQAQRTLAKLDDAASELKNGMSAFTGQGGALERLNESAHTITTTTLPRIQHLTEDASRTLRRIDRMAGALSDNPQALLYGDGPIPPGPGEPGFTPPRADTP